MAWLRWWDGTCADPKFRTIANKCGASVAEVLACWAFILETARERDGDIAKLHPDDLEACFGLTEGKAQCILGQMEARGLIAENRVVNWEKRQPRREDSSAERTREWRERKRSVTQGDAPVTQRDARVTQGDAPEAETETETDSETEIASSSPARERDVDRLEGKCREAAGVENHPSPGLFDMSPIFRLMTDGFDLEADILPIIRAMRARGRIITSWRYVEGAVRLKAQEDANIARAPPPPKSARRQQSSMDDIVAYAASQGVKVE